MIELIVNLLVYLLLQLLVNFLVIRYSSIKVLSRFKAPACILFPFILVLLYILPVLVELMPELIKNGRGAASITYYFYTYKIVLLICLISILLQISINDLIINRRIKRNK